MEECYELLANAIIEQACKDYVRAVKAGDPDRILECEHFFRSSWFGVLTDIDGTSLMRRLSKLAKNNLL
jgi:hypothetical protein